MRIRMTRLAWTIVTFITMFGVLMAMVGIMPSRALASSPTYQWEHQQIRLYDPDFVYVNDVCAVGPSEAWAIADTMDMMNGQHTSYVFRFDGTSWVEATNMRMVCLKSITALDANHVWVAGYDRDFDFEDAEWKSYGTIYFFDGSTWTEQYRATFEFGYDFRSIEAIDPTHVYALEGMGLSRVWFFDGSSWTQMPQADENFRDIDVLDAGHLYAAGERGTFEVFDGQTWKRVETGTSADLYSVAAADASHVWAVGQDGTIVFYNGKSCTIQASGTTSYLKSVDAVDFRTAVAVGDDSDNSTTACKFDGAGWTSTTYRDDKVLSLNTVSAVDRQHIFAAGKTSTDLDLDHYPYHYGYILSGTTDAEFGPALASIDPAAGYAGASVTLNGAELGSERGTSKVLFGDAEAVEYQAWSDTSVQVKVPAQASGACDAKVVTDRGASNGLGFTALPRIDAIFPGSAIPGGQVTISGSGLGSQGQVYFGSQAADGIASWTPTAIKVSVPADAYGATTVTVRTAVGTTNPAKFLVVPDARGISPASARTGQLVTISGNAFGPTRGTSQVLFGNVAARQFKYWSNRSIQVYVPTGFSGKVQVRVVTSGGQSSPLGFTKIGL